MPSANPGGFKGYGENCWGFSAGEGPGKTVLTIDGVQRRFLGYAARGAPFGPEDGTIAASSAVSSLPFAPELCDPRPAKSHRELSRRDAPRQIDERVQPDVSRCGPGRMGFQRQFRSRPGHPRADDRELSLRTYLGDHARVPLPTAGIATRGILRRLARGICRRMTQNALSRWYGAAGSTRVMF